MRKLIIYIVLLVVTISSCRKEDDHLFSESPDERLSKKLSAYQEQLSGAQYGWRLIIEPAGGGAYGFYVKFNNDNRVQMVSDFDSASAVTLKESSYRLKALQQPSLIFDTYSYVHVLADPAPAVNNGVWAQGLLSDFEFFFNDSSGVDTIQLTGRVNGSKAMLVKATQQEEEGYTTGEFNVNLFQNIFNKILQYFKQFTVGGQSYDLNFNLSTRMAIITWTDSQGNAHSFTTKIYFGLNGIEFAQPFLAGTTVVTGFFDPVWSNLTQTISGNVGNGTNASIKGVIKPQVLDTEAPRRWWQRMVDEDGYWVSLTGFHVDGVDDAYGLTGIENFVALSFFPKFGTSGGITYDLAGYLMNEDGTLTLSFGTAFRAPTFTADGRIRFGNYLGDLGDIPDDAVDPYVNTAIKMLESDGYYLVQISEDEYDMVNASNARAWIHWFAP
ncbi:hypothetical protein DC498_04475 [Terrimonas sp.]|uniref:DUF4302 domain-containing protein n=1 Tax=Terrimonas sp. TaxID=1914338 RepID=UPI000D51D64B|nr:DUF4302 domain-containing protein [Terrimonas sp.]PVD53771.1 hypothetical protein DC498_04475 [Terrimonas sp.]